MTENSIGAIIKKAEREYTTGTTVLGKYVTFSQYENLQKIDAYLNSKFTSGEFDSLGREKPFFNIVTGAVNIWYRATDIDRKNIRIKATTSKEYIWAFLATIHLQEWMKRDFIGKFLNKWGRSLARYGSSVVKFVEKEGELHADVVTWNTFICDTVDFDNNPKIEKLYLTIAQLKKNKNYDQDKVIELETALSARKTMDRNRIDNKVDYVELYEIHGELPLDLVTDNENDEDIYTQQMHVVSFVARGTQDDNGEDEFDEFTLLKGREAKDPYMITHLIEEEGRSQSIGAVEHLFQAQWMTNHTVKETKDQLDLASKLIFQTADESFFGLNALSNIETGDILIHKENMPLTQIQNNSHDITSLQNFGQQWEVLAKEITSTPDAINGNAMPSGTAYIQAKMLNQESHSLFELMTENKGLEIEKMMRLYIIPFLKKKMDTSKEISTTLESHDVAQLDSMFIKAEVTRRLNAHVKSHMLNDNGQGGTVAPPMDMQAEAQNVQSDLNATGNTRFIKPSDIDSVTWKEIFKDLEWECEVEVTNEQSDKQAIMATLSTVMQTVASNPAVLNDPNMKMVFMQILELTGSMSPLQLKQLPPAQPNAPTTVPNTSINYKDLSPELQAQLAGDAGLKSTNGGGASPVVGGGGANLPVKQ